MKAIPFQYNDGGRAAAGFKGEARDCAVMAVAIAAALPYRQVYDLMFRQATKINMGKRLNAEAWFMLFIRDIRS